jgi:hypothetical protein
MLPESSRNQRLRLGAVQLLANLVDEPVERRPCSRLTRCYICA